MSKRIEIASTAKIEEFPKEVESLLRHLAAILKEPEESEEEWLSYAFVSDESRIADFINEEELICLRNQIGLPDLAMCDLMCDVALALHDARSEQTDQ
jgi:hypothetical protein